MAGTIDLLPTAAAIAGGTLPASPVIDGCDISSLLLGETQDSPRRTHYYFSGHELQAVRQGPWKLAIAAQNETMGRPAKPDANTDALRLYNLDTEIGEMPRVAADHPAVVAQLSVLAETMRQEIGGKQPAARRPAGNVAKPSFLFPAQPRNKSPKVKKAQRKDQSK